MMPKPFNVSELFKFCIETFWNPDNGGGDDDDDDDDNNNNNNNNNDSWKYILHESVKIIIQFSSILFVLTC
jgi:hypothetical protein